jgi:Phosphotransferase system cellobiose-specific component IIB
MKKIVLFCAGGMSTSLLVNKMKEAAQLQGKEYDINAYGLGTADKEAPDASVILLGPQVRYAVKEMQTKFPSIPVAGIEMRTYGMMDGKAVLAQAIKLMGDDE